jgi:short-subunit dehydrogenase
MQDLTGRTAILTGASRGLGAHLARALSAEGVRLVLAARNAQALQALADELPGESLVVPTDVASAEDRARLVEQAEGFGDIDLLINNAGIEHAAAYEQQDPAQLQQTIAVNLEAPMLLTHAVLPGMLQRDRGHLVHMSSLAGLAPTPYGEAYGATKHGLVGFHRALRSSLKLRGSNVRSSVICPGFVRDVGMHVDMKADGGAASPAVMGTVSPEKVVRATLRAIRRDRPIEIVSNGPFWPVLVLQDLFPDLVDAASARLGAYEVFRGTAKGRGKG